jgi:hypothetical protein
MAADSGSKLFSTLKKPPSRTTCTILSRSPTAACAWAIRLIAQTRAAALAASVDDCGRGRMRQFDTEIFETFRDETHGCSFLVAYRNTMSLMSLCLIAAPFLLDEIFD